MLQFFRINDPYRIIFVFLILLAIRATWIIVGLPLSAPELKWLVLGERLGDGFTMYKDVFDYTGPLAAMLYKWLDLIFGRSRWVHMAFSTVLITIQAGVLNNILLKNKTYGENNYLPAFIYVILASSILDFFALSPQLMALTFILLALNYIFRRIDNIVTDELFLYSGIYLGLATLFYLPSLIFFVIFLLSFILFSSAILRRLLLFVYSAGAVFIIVWAYFFWHEASWDFMEDFLVSTFSRPRHYYVSYVELLGLSAWLLGVAIISLSTLFSIRVTNFQQKMQQVMVLFLLGGFGVILLSTDLLTADLLFFVPSVTFFLVYYLLSLKRRFWRFVVPYLIILGSLVYPYYWLKNQNLKDMLVKESSLDFSGKRLMGIGTDISVYQDYKLAGPFLDEYVTEQKLEDLNYYSEASKLFEALNDSKADVIVDQKGIIPKIFQRFPLLKSQFEEKSEGIYLRINN